MGYIKTDLEKREKLKLTLNEYAIADYISNLSNNPKNKWGGWCIASKQTISKEFGIHRVNVQRIIDRLVINGILEKDPETKYLKPTKKWMCETLQPVAKRTPTCSETLQPKKSKQDQKVCETLHNNDNNIYKDIINTFNANYGTKYRSVRTIQKNIDYWLEEYSAEDIIKAIKNAKKDAWFKDVHDIEVFFRRTDTKGAPVDRIGKYLSLSQEVGFRMIGGQNEAVC